MRVRTLEILLGLFPRPGRHGHRWRRRRVSPTIATALLVGLPLLAAGGCASTGTRGFWPDRHDWTRAARTATRSAATWGPAAAAAAIAVSGRDDDLAAGAARETPLFGSTEKALEASDDLRLATHVAMTLSALATTTDEHRWRKRIERLLVENGAAVATTTVTRGLKELTHRTRPDGSDDLSFPSGHSSRSFAYSAAARRNLRWTNLRPGLRRGIGLGVDALAAGTAWARVEGGVHYPSDVLAGAALGNFVAILVHDAFFGSGPQLAVMPSVASDHFSFTVHLRLGGRGGTGPRSAETPCRCCRLRADNRTDPGTPSCADGSRIGANISTSEPRRPHSCRSQL